MKRAVITGGSVGIGAALSRELTKRGWAVATLSRRTTDGVSISCDVTDAAAVHDAVRQAEEKLGGEFDLAVANAGVSVPNHAAKFSLTDAEHTIRVNVLGMLNLYAAVIPSMVQRRSGQFAGVASIAGLRGLPSAGPYSASKAAMQAFLEASRVELLPHNVRVTVVNPGFIATAMTEKNRFRMPFLMQPDAAARVIADGIERGKRVVEFPRPMSMRMRARRLLPDAIYDRVMKGYAGRKMDPGQVKR